MSERARFASHDLLELARHCQRLWGRPEPAAFPEVERRVTLLAEREGAIADCLLVVLLGGTKVGKTTLVNALAGREVGKASARACYTARPALYVHDSREAQARSRLSGVLLPEDLCERHGEAALERIILVDAPDIDGIEDTHHEIFARLLERADLAICVVTTQKYDSAALYRILGDNVGFRRTVFVFNRIDEGIPFSETIREDFLAKIAGFALRPPAGETLPVFAISALHALQAKNGQPTGPRGDFPALEALLRERLDQALVRKISSENLEALALETREFVLRACRVEQAREVIGQIGLLAETTAREVTQSVGDDILSTWQELTVPLAGRRAAASAHAVGGPFSAYLYLLLAVRAMSYGLVPSFTTPERAASNLLRSLQERLQEASSRFARRAEEFLDRQGLDPQPLRQRLESPSNLPLPRAEELARIIHEHIGTPRAGWFESLGLNLAPLVVILLTMRYFVICLVSAREPGAGMFIGAGLILWLICHLQATFWLPRQSRSLETPPEMLMEKLSNHARARLGEQFQLWKGESELVTKEPPVSTPSRP